MGFLLLHALRIGALALLAAGLSGLLAEPVSWRTGMDHFAGDARARVGEVSVERCAELARLHRRQVTCAGALVEDQFDELVRFGLGATLAAGAALVLLRRVTMPPRDRTQAVVEALVLTAAVVAFAAVAAADLPAGLAGVAGLEPGSGRSLLQGGVSAVLGALLLAQAVNRWRRLAA
jgi:hypothetical protein